MSSEVRKLALALDARVPFVDGNGDPLTDVQRRAIRDHMRTDRQPKCGRGKPRKKVRVGAAKPAVVTIDLRPMPRATRGRHPVTGRKLGGAASSPSPVPFGRSFRALPLSKNDDPVYRKQGL